MATDGISDQYKDVFFKTILGKNLSDVLKTLGLPDARKVLPVNLPAIRAEFGLAPTIFS